MLHMKPLCTLSAQALQGVCVLKFFLGPAYFLSREGRRSAPSTNPGMPVGTHTWQQDTPRSVEFCNSSTLLP